MKVKKSIIALLVAADILAFPFLRPLPVTFSMLPVLLWALFALKKAHATKENIAIGFFFLAVFFSTSLALLVLPEKVLDEEALSAAIKQNSIYFFLLTLFFSYYKFLSTALESWNFNPLSLIRAYYCFNFLLAIWYLVDFQSYFSIRSIWTYSGNFEAADELSSIVRFTGIFSDPNNAATATVALYCYLYLYDRASSIRTAGYTMICLFVIITTMSSTGIVTLAMVFGGILIAREGDESAAHNRRLNKLMFALLLLMAAVLVFVFISKTEVGQLALDRFSENSADSRLEKFGKIIGFDIVKYIFWGDGGSIYVDSVIFRPHVGHLHLIYNYGVIAYICFIFSVFRIRRGLRLVHYLPILSLFLGFSANTGFIDFRFTAVASLLLAAYFAKSRPQTASQNTGV